MPLNVLEKMEGEAREAIIDYLDEHPEWADLIGPDDAESFDRYQDTMLDELFNDDDYITEDVDCRNIVEDDCLLMCEVINYVIERSEEEGDTPPSTVVAMFQKYWYYVGKDLIREEWDDLVQGWLERQDLGNNNEEEETKDDNNNEEEETKDDL
jgi:hypothetical protein